MTVERLHAEWGGGKQGVPKPAVIRAASAGGDSQSAVKLNRRKIARYGWKPDLPDQRDFSYCVPPSVVQRSTAAIDLSPQCPPVYDQGQIGSCTANAIAAALEFDMMKQGEASFAPSRLFIYYNESGRWKGRSVPTPAPIFVTASRAWRVSVMPRNRMALRRTAALRGRRLCSGAKGRNKAGWHVLQRRGDAQSINLSFDRSKPR